MLKDIHVGDLNPVFTPNGRFTADVNVPVGVIKDLALYVHGTHVTAITTACTDPEWNLITSLRVYIPRKTRPAIIWDLPARDLKWITAYWAGTTPANVVTAADGGVHYGLIKIPFYPPDVLCSDDGAWGINSDELAGPIHLEGQFGPAANIGVGATVVASTVRVSVGIDQTPRRASLALCGSTHFIAHESAQRSGKTLLAAGNAEFLYGLYLRQHDNSATAAQRVDGLVTRFIAEHSTAGTLFDQLFIVLKKETGLLFKLAAAESPAGVCIFPADSKALLDTLPPMVGGRSVSLLMDSAETVPDEVTDVTPAAGDGVYVGFLGVQLAAEAAGLLARVS